MIGWLGGTIRDIEPTGTIIVESHGVGYEVTLSMQTLCTLKVGASCVLFIHTHVREDQLLLFGFASRSERTLFRKLTSVSGIGAKIALSMLSGMSEAQLLDAIEHGDDTALARTPGIGKKTAQRVILELRGKLTSAAAATVGDSSNRADLRSALANLGYKPAAIDKALCSLETSGDFATDFKLALKALS